MLVLMTTPTNVDPAKLAAWRSFCIAHARLTDQIAREMEAEAGLSLNWYEVLLSLENAPDHQMRMHELAESLLLSRSATTRFAERMERAGLVRRVRCNSDRRGMWIVPTEEGRAAFRVAAPIHQRGVQEHFAAFVDGEDAERLRKLMSRLTDSLETC
jgi:DNA-binding MarR family transcriptional regulator